MGFQLLSGLALWAAVQFADWAAFRLRATVEALAPATVLHLGQLDEVGSPAGFRIVPCVGAIPRGFEATPSPDEIDEVFAVPMSALANPQLAEDREVVINGKRRTIRIYHVGCHLIWGLTARIVQNLLARLGISGTLGE